MCARKRGSDCIAILFTLVAVDFSQIFLYRLRFLSRHGDKRYSETHWPPAMTSFPQKTPSNCDFSWPTCVSAVCELAEKATLPVFMREGNFCDFSRFNQFTATNLDITGLATASCNSILIAV